MSQKHPSATLARVAELLDPPERERFMLVVARFRNIPQDDEYLQVLEAIGFMTLLWKSVPSDIQRILEGANPVRETCLNLTKLVREAVAEAIPSHQDLRSVTQTLREHETALKSMCRMSSSQPQKAGANGIIITLLLTALLLLLGERFGIFRLL